MSKQVTIDWQRDGLLVATGHRRGASVLLDRVVQKTNVAGSAELPLGQLLRDAIGAMGLSKADATVIVPRELLEARTLQIPRGDADEVPDIVRFQAQRQMANMGDNWALDFVMLPEGVGQESLAALAFTIAPGVMTEIETACADAGLILKHVVARPIEVARFATTLGGLPSEGVTLVISLSDGQADLLLLRDGRVAQIRGTRLPHDSDQLSNGLIAEVRRSLLAAAGNLDGQSIARTLLIASADLAQKVEVQVAEATRSEVRLLDPAILLPASLDHKFELAHSTASRLAAIAAVVSDPAPSKETLIDLKNPKRRPPKKKNIGRYALIGSSVAAVLLFGISWLWKTHSELDKQLASLQQASKDLDGKLKIAEKQIKDRLEVDGFLKGSVNWLDQLEYIAQKIPPAEKVQFLNSNLQVHPNGVGVVTVGILADSAETISAMEESLRDNKHQVTSSGSSVYAKPSKLYRWTADDSIVVLDSGWDPLAKPKTAAAPAPIPAKPGDATAQKKAVASTSDAKVNN